MSALAQMGKAGLQGWRTKVGDAVAPPIAQRSSLDEDAVRAAIGALFFVLAAKYVVSTATTVVRQLRGG